MRSYTLNANGKFSEEQLDLAWSEMIKLACGLGTLFEIRTMDKGLFHEIAKLGDIVQYPKNFLISRIPGIVTGPTHQGLIRFLTPAMRRQIMQLLISNKERIILTHQDYGKHVTITMHQNELDKLTNAIANLNSTSAIH